MFSKSTKNFGLPQWQFGDHPAFMGDMNPAYATIDELMKENRDAGDSAKERLDVLAPIVTANSQQISNQTSKIASISVDLQNAEHAINDCKQNIAQNAADIAALQEEDHNIHETADADRANFYKVLNCVKETLPETVVLGSAAVGTDAKAVSCLREGHTLWMDLYITGATLIAGTNRFSMTPNADLPSGMAISRSQGLVVKAFESQGANRTIGIFTFDLSGIQIYTTEAVDNGNFTLRGMAYCTWPDYTAIESAVENIPVS